MLVFWRKQAGGRSSSDGRFGVFLSEFAKLLCEVIYRWIRWRSMVLVTMKWHLLPPVIQKMRPGTTRTCTINREKAVRSAALYHTPAKTRLSVCWDVLLRLTSSVTNEASTQFFSDRKKNDGGSASSCKETWVSLCYVFLTVFVTMEGTNSKNYKSRLFTSNVLLQKDELEEVSSMNIKSVLRAQQGCSTLSNLSCFWKFMGSIPVRDSDFFFVPCSCHIDYYIF